MPGNAAAEGGYGLGVGDAFGGGVSSAGPGTGASSASPSEGPGASAVGGAFGGFGPDMGTTADDAAQSGVYGSGTPTPGNAASNAQALATRAENLAQQAAANRAAAAAANAMRGKSQSTLGLGTGVAVAVAQNAVNAAMSQNGTVTGQDIASISDATGLPPGFVSGLAQEAAIDAAMNAAVNANMATKGSSIGIGSIESLNPTVTSATPMSGMVATVDENGNIVSYGLDQIDVTPEDSVVSTSVAPSTTSVAPVSSSVNVAPVSNTISMAPTVSLTSSSRPQSRPDVNMGLGTQLSMGLANLTGTLTGKSKGEINEGLMAKGYTPSQVSMFDAMTMNNIRGTNAAVENAIGSRDGYYDDTTGVDNMTSSELLLYGYPTDYRQRFYRSLS